MGSGGGRCSCWWPGVSTISLFVTYWSCSTSGDLILLVLPTRTSGRSMRSCMWITSAVGSSDSAASRATGVAAAALSLSSAPTTAYPVIFFSILTAMTRFLVFVFVGLGAGGHVAGGAGEEQIGRANV